MDHLAASMVEWTCEREGVDPTRLVLHADNGGPMKGSTMLATTPAARRCALASVGPTSATTNPYVEALFRTLKFRPGYPRKPFGVSRARPAPGVTCNSLPGTTASTSTARFGTSRPMIATKRRDQATPRPPQGSLHRQAKRRTATTLDRRHTQLESHWRRRPPIRPKAAIEPCIVR